MMAFLGINNLQGISPRALLRKGSFSANVLTLTAGSTLAQGVNVAATLVLARVFSPADFGILALFIGITSFLSVVGSLRYETAIVLPGKHEEAANLKVLSFLILLGMCGLSLLSVAFFRTAIARVLDEPRLAPWLWGVPIGLFVSGIYQILNYWCTRMKQFHRLAIAGVSQSLGTIGSQLGLFAVGLGGPMALVFGWVFGQAIGAFMIAVPALRENVELIRTSLDWASMRSELSKYKNFPLYNAPYSFVGNAGQQLVLIVLRVFTDIRMVGLFSMATKIIYLPVTLLSSSMRQVFYEKAATELKSGRLESFVLQIMKLQVVLGTPILFFFAFEAQPLFRVVLGRNWEAVGVYAAMLAFLGYVYFLTTWMECVFDVQGRQNLALIWQVSRDVLAVGGLAIALRLSANPILSTGVYVGVDLLCTVIWLVVAFRIANFVTKNLWQVGALFLGTGTVAVLLLWGVHLVFRARETFILSGILIMVMEAVIFLKYAKRSQIL